MYTLPLDILIADSHYLTRTGLKQLLSSQHGFEIVGEVANSLELRKNLPSLKPNVVILDYDQEGHFSIDDIQHISDNSPISQVLVISSDTEKTRVLKALELGALGFLTKSCDAFEILGAIKATANQQKYFCSKVLDIVLERESDDQDEGCDPIPPLSDRELDVVRLMVQGANAQKIAEELCLSIHTVYTHRKNIMRKLHVSTAAEVILYAIQMKLVEA
ncbi:MAG: response regulator transcription factor [Bacteroidota bacterium]